MLGFFSFGGQMVDASTISTGEKECVDNENSDEAVMDMKTQTLFSKYKDSSDRTIAESKGAMDTTCADTLISYHDSNTNNSNYDRCYNSNSNDYNNNNNSNNNNNTSKDCCDNFNVSKYSSGGTAAATSTFNDGRAIQTTQRQESSSNLHVLSKLMNASFQSDKFDGNGTNDNSSNNVKVQSNTFRNGRIIDDNINHTNQLSPKTSPSNIRTTPRDKVHKSTLHSPGTSRINDNQSLGSPQHSSCPSSCIFGSVDCETNANDKMLTNIKTTTNKKLHLGVGSANSLGSRSASEPKSCTRCGTTRTPLWRNGPDGPKTLCNACGVRDNRLANKRQHGSARRAANESGKSALKVQKKHKAAPKKSAVIGKNVGEEQRLKLVNGKFIEQRQIFRTARQRPDRFNSRSLKCGARLERLDIKCHPAKLAHSLKRPRSTPMTDRSPAQRRRLLFGSPVVDDALEYLVLDTRDDTQLYAMVQARLEESMIRENSNEKANADIPIPAVRQIVEYDNSDGHSIVFKLPEEYVKSPSHDTLDKPGCANYETNDEDRLWLKCLNESLMNMPEKYAVSSDSDSVTRSSLSEDQFERIIDLFEEGSASLGRKIDSQSAAILCESKEDGGPSSEIVDAVFSRWQTRRDEIESRGEKYIVSEFFRPAPPSEYRPDGRRHSIWSICLADLAHGELKRRKHAMLSNRAGLKKKVGKKGKKTTKSHKKAAKKHFDIFKTSDDTRVESTFINEKAAFSDSVVEMTEAIDDFKKRIAPPALDLERVDDTILFPELMSHTRREDESGTGQRPHGIGRFSNDDMSSKSANDSSGLKAVGSEDVGTKVGLDAQFTDCHELTKTETHRSTLESTPEYMVLAADAWAAIGDINNVLDDEAILNADTSHSNDENIQSRDTRAREIPCSA